jgi:hypothetical protein
VLSGNADPRLVEAYRKTADKKAIRKIQVMTENCRKISRYAGQEFH